LVQANLVQDDVEIQNLQHAQEVDISALQQQQAQRQNLRRKRFCRLGIVTTTLILGIISAVCYVSWQSNKNNRPPASIVASASTPTHLPNSIIPDLGVLCHELPVTTQQNIGSYGTPQYYAWNWLQQYANEPGVNFTDSKTYPLQRKKELFALATFAYAFDWPNWPKEIKNDWLILDPKRHECTWFNGLYTTDYVLDEFNILHS
jgi:hypothetical protein